MRLNRTCRNKVSFGTIQSPTYPFLLNPRRLNLTIGVDHDRQQLRTCNGGEILLLIVEGLEALGLEGAGIECALKAYSGTSEQISYIIHVMKHWYYSRDH